MSPASAGRQLRPDTDVVELLDLEVVERDFFRGNTVFDDPQRLYGGQVAAQALRAAALTVPEGRLPHSLHGYFLRGGDASRPTVFRVDRDRDGRSFSARRVVAIQNGEVIFNMSASFHVAEDGPDHQIEPMPDAGEPDGLVDFLLPRLTSIEARLPPQPYPGDHWPTRFWARCTVPLGGDPLLHAAVLTYLSDLFTGLAPFDVAVQHSGASLDHAVWFHQPIRLDEWVLMDLVPRRTAGGRGWYTGTLHNRDGALGASLTQETLFRARRDTGPR